MSDTLNYFFNGTAGVSLDIRNSDDMVNALLFKHLIGTLVRFSSGGRYEPYLAESYSVSEDYKTWKFKIRQGLKCENGEKITPEGYVLGLNRVLKLLSQTGDLPVFSKILGFESLREGQKIPGITSDLDYVIFSFRAPTGAGFLEYLSMPYYGYLCSANFKSDIWTASEKIISSGPYILRTANADKTIIELKLRKDWPLLKAEAPESVKYTTIVPPNVWHSKHSIVQKTLDSKESEPTGFNKLLGPPDSVKSVVLNPEGPSNFFNSKEARFVLQSTIVNIRDKKSFNSRSSTKANRFFSGSTSALDDNKEARYADAKPVEPLKVYSNTPKTEDARFILEVLIEALDELKWPYKLYLGGQHGISPNNAYSRSNFDIRVTSVIAGHAFEAWVVDMMFCSNLGVSFPDPEGKICEKLAEYERQDKPVELGVAGREISGIIHAQACVLPILHGRTNWYFSSDLNTDNLAGDLILPSFEDIRVQND